MKPSLEKTSFGVNAEGNEIDLFTLRSGTGAGLTLSSLGATIVALEMPDRDGKFDDIVLGYGDLSGYLSDAYYFGCVVGRYANRIAMGRFSLEGSQYELPVNDRGNHLHGGPAGLHRAVWRSDSFLRSEEVGVSFYYRSPAGDQGYPGALDIRVTYCLGGSDSIRVDYEAQTDATTIVNLTQHAYFNLAGQGKPSVLEHWLKLRASQFTPVGETGIPTGKLLNVEGTPMDFNKPRRLGDRIDAPHEQLRKGGGYDHNWVVDGTYGTLRHAARLFSPESGRVLDVLTTEPGIQVYTGNFLTGDIQGKKGAKYPRRSAVCLETQHFPDSPNQPGFPSTVLRAGETFSSTTQFSFSTTDSQTWPSG